MDNSTIFAVKCNRCGYKIETGREKARLEYNAKRYDYCPNCRQEFPQCNIKENTL